MPYRMVAGILVALGLAHLWYHATYTLDDAYVTYRYARNFARGVGLVYNPGSYVKGYSNTLWTALMIVPELAGHDPKLFAKWLGCLAYLAMCAVAYRLYARETVRALSDRTLWLLACFAACTPFAVHFVNGLETGLHTALLLAAVLGRVREQDADSRPYSAALFALAVWSRPEGIAFFIAIAAHDAVWRVTQRRWSAHDAWFYALPALAYAAELGLSYAYYGAAFPQTYYAKTVATGGLLETLRVLWHGVEAQAAAGSYLREGMKPLGVGAAGLLLLPISLLDPRMRRRNCALLLTVCAQLLFIVRAGDDWAPAFRFGVPMLPFVFVLWIDALGTLAALTRRYTRWATALLAAGLLALSLPAQLQASLDIQARRYVNAENKLREGSFLATLAAPGATLASFDIGGQGYAAGGFDVLDAVGLTLRETSHCRDRMTPACTRYAALVLPELVRLHSNSRRDAFVSKTVQKQQAYLELEGGKYLLQRALVLSPVLPEGAIQHGPVATGPVQLLAQDFPSALLPRAQTQITLFWRRGVAPPAALDQRRLEWVGAAGHFNAQASEVLWKHASIDVWRPEEIFADLITIQAPHVPGRFELHVITRQQRVVLGSLDVLTAAVAPVRARQLAVQAELSIKQDHELQGIRMWRCAAQLSTSSARTSYQRAVIARAERLRGEAERLEPNDAIGALRIAQSAKVLLHRAYWESGRATRSLRRAIDVNAAVRQRIIDREIGKL